MYLILLVLPAIPVEPLPEETGQWVRSFDPDWQPPGYRGPMCGKVAGTDYVDEALKFRTPQEAFELWRKVSTRVPRRPDGRPNRPLTAWTIEVVPVENAEKIRRSLGFGRSE